MNARKVAVILAAIAALIAVAAPAGAGATKTVHRPAETSAILAGKAAQGFEFAFFAFDRAEILALDKALPGNGDEGIAYVALPHSSAGIGRGRLDVRIGKLGHFRGHFVATSTKARKPPVGCEGEPTKVEEGYFAGSFVFHGERGFTTIHAPRESGAITRRGATDCPRPANDHSGGRHNSPKVEKLVEEAAERDELRLLAGGAKADLVLQATREQAPPEPDGPAATTFEVSANGKKVDGFEVIRSASVLDGGREAAAGFLVPNLAEPLAEATLEPPAPFSGSATFRLEGPQTASWAGDLAVELPGLGKVPLTGKGIYAGACRGATNCTDTLPTPLSDLIRAQGTIGQFAAGVVEAGS